MELTKDSREQPTLSELTFAPFVASPEKTDLTDGLARVRDFAIRFWDTQLFVREIFKNEYSQSEIELNRCLSK